MKQKKFKQEVIDTFQQLSGKTFTVAQALQVYMATPSKIHTDSKSARQYVHRNILRFASTGELIKVSSEGLRHEYLMTEKFSSRLVESKTVQPLKGTEPLVRKSALEKSLKERLNHQKLKLLTAMGEAEEYDAIYKELPEIGTQIQELYNESRDRCSKLLGKVKAIENLITLGSN